MKTSTFLLLIILSSLCVSCNKDTDEDLLVGTWLIKQRENKNCDKENRNYTNYFSNGCFNSGLFLECSKLTFTNKKTW